MNFVQSTVEQIGAFDETTNPTAIMTLVDAALPAYAQGASSMWCQVQVVASDDCQLLTFQSNNTARQTWQLSAGIGYDIKMVVPFNTLSTVFRLITIPSSFTMTVNLIGWWG